MRAERWFNVLVLGGAALAHACLRASSEQGNTPEGHSGSAPSAAGNAAEVGGCATNSSGSVSTGGSGASTGGFASMVGGSSATGGSSDSAGHAGSGGTGGADQAGSSSNGAVGGDSTGGQLNDSAGAAGSAGSGMGPVCHTNAMGLGKASDPCGCACCWAHDCLNTEACCDGFCKGADSGRGCCAP